VVAAVALLYATTQGWPYNWQGWRQQVDPTGDVAWLSQIGLRWLNGVLHRRTLLSPSPLLPKDPQPCFASYPAEEDFIYDFGSHVSVLCPARCDFSALAQMCQAGRSSKADRK